MSEGMVGTASILERPDQNTWAGIQKRQERGSEASGTCDWLWANFHRLRGLDRQNVKIQATDFKMCHEHQEAKIKWLIPRYTMAKKKQKISLKPEKKDSLTPKKSQ